MDKIYRYITNQLVTLGSTQLFIFPVLAEA